MMKKGKASGVLLLEAAGMGKLEVSELEVGCPVWLISGSYTAFSDWSSVGSG